MDLLRNLKKDKYDFEIVYKDREIRQYVLCFLSAVLIIAVCSRSSFLYAFNIWDDANSYFTVGKCIFRGFVPYRDLFDQKGIMLYFIYGLASLISPTTFLGVYVFEVIAAFFSLLAIFKIYLQFLKNGMMPYIITPITGAVIYSSYDFWWGGSAEEFLFPFIMWGLYLTVYHFRNIYPEPMDYRIVLLGGILAGCVLNIKFSSLGFFFGWMAFVFFADLITGRAVKKAFVSCFVFLGGMGIATIPWIIYFGLNGAIYDWGYVYIYKNVFEYSKKLTLPERVAVFYDIVKNHILNNELVFILIFIGVIYFIGSAVVTTIGKNDLKRLLIRVRLSELWCLGMELFFLVFVLFVGGVSLPYYPFPVNGFVMFGFIPFCYIIEGLINKKAGHFWVVVSLVVTFLTTWFMSVNTRFYGVKAQDLYIYKFRDYIRSTGIANPGIIVQFTFDVGLYTVLDEEPICYYFQTQTLNMDEVLEYQEQYLRSGEADFIVTCDYFAEGEGDRYDLVMTDECRLYNFEHTYYLYQRNGNPVSE